MQLKEDTRNQLVSKSKSVDIYKHNIRGKNRFERKKFSKIATQVKNYNNINMDDFFKADLLTINIPVTGETSEYDVTLKVDGVVTEIAKNIKNNNNKLVYIDRNKGAHLKLQRLCETKKTKKVTSNLC